MNPSGGSSVPSRDVPCNNLHRWPQRPRSEPHLVIATQHRTGPLVTTGVLWLSSPPLSLPDNSVPPRDALVLREFPLGRIYSSFASASFGLRTASGTYLGTSSLLSGHFNDFSWIRVFSQVATSFGLLVFRFHKPTKAFAFQRVPGRQRDSCHSWPFLDSNFWRPITFWCSAVISGSLDSSIVRIGLSGVLDFPVVQSEKKNRGWVKEYRKAHARDVWQEQDERITTSARS